MPKLAPPSGKGSWGLRSLLRVRPLHSLYATGMRHVAARRIRRDLRGPKLGLEHAIATIERRWGPAVMGSAAERPIFILGAGWRCGSTWLQRLVMSSGQALIWGEPFDRSGIVQTMSGQLLPLAQEWPPDNWFADETGVSDLADRWVANLYPPVPTLIEAHRGLFRQLFDLPARDRGVPRWGVKEVRLTTGHAAYLRLLFPGARFVFLVRNPVDAYRSYRGAWNPWFERWPDRLTVSARQFGRMWSRLARDFVDNHRRVHGLLVKYEDLVANPATMKTISDHLELPLVPERAARPIRGNPHEKDVVPYLERWLLNGEIRAVGRALGYE